MNTKRRAVSNTHANDQTAAKPASSRLGRQTQNDISQARKLRYKGTIEKEKQSWNYPYHYQGTEFEILMYLDNKEYQSIKIRELNGKP